MPYFGKQDVWDVAAAGFQSSPRLGQREPRTGLQLFIRVNCKLGLLGHSSFDRTRNSSFECYMTSGKTIVDFWFCSAEHH